MAEVLKNLQAGQLILRANHVAPTLGRTCVKTAGLAKVAGTASSSRGADTHAVTL